MSADGVWSRSYPPGKVIFKNTETGQVIELDTPYSIEIELEQLFAGGVLTVADFRPPSSITLSASYELARAAPPVERHDFLDQFRNRRPGRSRRKRARR